MTSASLSSIEEKIAELPKCISGLKTMYQNVLREIKQLEGQGVIFASPYWHQDKYLYLNYPSKKGEGREREYIGANRNKTAKALKKVERGEKYKVLEEKKEALELKINLISQKLDELVIVIETTKPKR